MSSAHRLWVAVGALFILLCGLAANAQDQVIAKVNGKTITEADMKLAEAEIGNDLGSLPPATKRRVLAEFLIENQLFADAAEGQKLGAGAAFNERMQYWRRRALRDAYFDTSVKDSVNDAEAKKFYDSQVGGMKPEEEVRARHILVESKEKGARDFRETGARVRFWPACQGALQGPRLQGPGRRARLLCPRANGATVRGGGLQAADRRGRRALPEPIRLARRPGR